MVSCIFSNLKTTCLSEVTECQEKKIYQKQTGRIVCVFVSVCEYWEL